LATLWLAKYIRTHLEVYTTYRVNSRQLDIGTDHLYIPILPVRYCRSFTSL